MVKPSSLNWPLLLVSLVQEMTGWPVSFYWQQLPVGIVLPLCNKTVDDWMGKAADNGKLRRSSEAERNRYQREIERLPPIGANSTPEERKAYRELVKDLEQAECTVNKCESEAFRWNCHRIQPIASDSDGYL